MDMESIELAVRSLRDLGLKIPSDMSSIKTIEDVWSIVESDDRFSREVFVENIGFDRPADEDYLDILRMFEFISNGELKLDSLEVMGIGNDVEVSFRIDGTEFEFEFTQDYDQLSWDFIESSLKAINSTAKGVLVTSSNQDMPVFTYVPRSVGKLLAQDNERFYVAGVDIN